MNRHGNQSTTAGREIAVEKDRQARGIAKDLAQMIERPYGLHWKLPSYRADPLTLHGVLLAKSACLVKFQNGLLRTVQR